ncbi:MAG TPA: hydroxymethylbilane synthase [Nitrolancea sp.]|nr:hydroxymethylbilane synthase [Nitrolancea sp.]
MTTTGDAGLARVRDGEGHTLRAALCVGTRGSALALEQTRRVVALLQAAAPELTIETRLITTHGDVDKQTPLAVLGGQGVFAKEIEAALLAGEIDLAVHSAKDLTSELPRGLIIAAIPERDDPRDALVAPTPGLRLDDLSPGAHVGTSSRRRALQLQQARPDLVAVELRGNVDTRLRKVRQREGGLAAGILAASGLLRMGWQDAIAEVLPLDTFLPAPGQGALAVECRADDEPLRALLATIDDPAVARAVAIERAFLRAVGGGCRSPIGAFAVIQDERVLLRAMLGDEENTTALYASRLGALADAEELAAELARGMLQQLAERVAAAR